MAAITYTVGTRPYGYILVWVISQYSVFFGWLSVLGSWYLQAHNVEAGHFSAGDSLRSAGDRRA